MIPELGKPPKVRPLSEEGQRTARRAFLAGSIAAAPLITTLASRPAWAGCVTYSVMYSGIMNHDSHAAQTECYGMPATYWRVRPGMVDQYVEVGPANPVDYDNVIYTATDYSYPTDDELKEAWKKAVKLGDEVWKKAIKKYQNMLKKSSFSYPTPPFGTKFQDIFGSYYAGEENMTIMQALWRDDLQLVCQSACAWLNANESPSGYPYPPSKVIEYFNNTGFVDAGGLADAFALMNRASLDPV